MSNTERLLTVELLSEKAIRLAVEQLIKDGKAIELVHDAAPRMYYPDQFVKDQTRLGKSPTAELVIRCRETNYDVGLVKEGKRFIPVFDPHAGYVSSVLGSAAPVDWSKKEDHLKKAIGGFVLEYSVQNTMMTCRAQGHQCQRVTNPLTGRPRVKIAIPA